MKPPIEYRPKLSNGGRPSPANAASAVTPATAKSATRANTKPKHTPAARVTANANSAASGTSATVSGGKRKLNSLLKELEASADPKTVIANMAPAELSVLALYLWIEKKLKRANKAKAQKAWRDKQAKETD